MYGKTRLGPRRPRLRPQHGQVAGGGRPSSICDALVAGVGDVRPLWFGMVRDRRRQGEAALRYYRCTGKEPSRHGGAAICRQSACADELAAVWADVKALLAAPEKVAAEYQRRLTQQTAEGEQGGFGETDKQVGKLKRSIKRLIEA